MRGLGRAALLAAFAAGAMAPAGAAVAAPVSAAPAAASWQIDLKVTGSSMPQFTAVTAGGATSAWAFEAAGSAAPKAYQFDGSGWTAQPFPDPKGDQVFSASADSPTDAWAFSFQDRVLHYDGSNWTIVKRFAKPVESGLAISSSNVWVFGQSFAPELGTWHYNGATWTKVSSGGGLNGASALSANSIWAYGGTNVAHWNGSTWKKTSVKSLIPKNGEFTRWQVTGIVPISSASVYAIASGGKQDVGGPIAVLHYNGHAWTRLVLTRAAGGPVGVSGDGSGGLWIPTLAYNSPGQSGMDHFAHGALHVTTLPYAPAHLFLYGVATAPHGKVAFTVGFYHKQKFDPTATTAVILRYGS